MTGQPGRRAVVTGAASGIGRAVAAELRRSGLRVLGIDRNPCHEVDGLVVDLAETARLDALVAEIDDEEPVDVLVNCAGIFHPQLAADLSWADHEHLLRINLHAPTLLMSRWATRMAERRYGRIVNITSIHARFSEPTALSYDIAKAGLAAATRTVAIETAAAGVLVNAVAPGFVDTGMSVIDGQNELESPEFRDQYVATGRLPIRRAAAPAEVAGLVAYLVSEQNTYTTGSTVTVDGGLCARF